jgi:hypothetical protein
MTNFKRFSIAAALSAAITTPAIAQQAVQEPGLLAFYQSLGVGSASSRTAYALAPAGSVSLSLSAAAKQHARAQHYGNTLKR